MPWIIAFDVKKYRKTIFFILKQKCTRENLMFLNKKKCRSDIKFEFFKYKTAFLKLIIQNGFFYIQPKNNNNDEKYPFLRFPNIFFF